MTHSIITTLTPNSPTASVAGGAQRRIHDLNGWKLFEYTRKAAQEWSALDTLVQEFESSFGPHRLINPKDNKVNKTKRALAQSKFLQGHRLLPKSSQLPTITDALVHELGGTWASAKRDSQEPEVMNRGLGWLTLRKRAVALMDAFEQVSKVLDEQRKAHSRFDSLQRAVDKVLSLQYQPLIDKAKQTERWHKAIETGWEASLPAPESRCLREEWETAKQHATAGLMGARELTMQKFASRVKAGLDQATGWADASGLDVRMTADLARLTSAAYKEHSGDPEKPVSDESRMLGSGLQFVGYTEADKREPDLTNDPSNLAFWAHGHIEFPGVMLSSDMIP